MYVCTLCVQEAGQARPMTGVTAAGFSSVMRGESSFSLLNYEAVYKLQQHIFGERSNRPSTLYVMFAHAHCGEPGILWPTWPRQGRRKLGRHRWVDECMSLPYRLYLIPIQSYTLYILYCTLFKYNVLIVRRPQV